MIRPGHRRPGYAAALIHRLSGVALALFLPMHFVALGTAPTTSPRP
jgi:fumarate reductase subunit D